MRNKKKSTNPYKEANESFLTEKAKEEGIIVLDNGVMYRKLEEGHGTKCPKPNKLRTWFTLSIRTVFLPASSSLMNLMPTVALSANSISISPESNLSSCVSRVPVSSQWEGVTDSHMPPCHIVALRSFQTCRDHCIK